MTLDSDVNLTIDHRIAPDDAKALLCAWREHTQRQLSGDESHDAALHRIIRNIDGALDLLAVRYDNQS